MPRKRRVYTTCTAPDCDQLGIRRGLCVMHDCRLRRTGSFDAVSRSEATKRGKAKARDPFLRTMEGRRARARRGDEAARAARRPKLENDPAVQLYRAELAMRAEPSKQTIHAAAEAFVQYCEGR